MHWNCYNIKIFLIWKERRNPLSSLSKKKRNGDTEEKGEEEFNIKWKRNEVIMLHNFLLQQTFQQFRSFFFFFSGDLFIFRIFFAFLFILPLLEIISQLTTLFILFQTTNINLDIATSFSSFSNARNHMQISSFLLVLCEYLDVSRKD